MEVGDVVPVELTQFAASLENSYTKLLWSTQQKQITKVMKFSVRLLPIGKMLDL
jgi:hypothetical protein